MDGFQVKNGQCERLIFLRETPNSSVERDRYDVRPPLDGFGGVDRLISEAPHGRPAFDVIVLSHLRWDFVFQRPQHLLSRCARQHRVFFVEEPITTDGPAWMDVSTPRPGVWVAAPHLPEGVSACEAEAIQHHLLDAFIAEYRVRSYVLWYYTPMAMAFSQHLDPLATVYDCMDELSAFAGAPPEMRKRETALLSRADLVFTGGQSLYEAKCGQHPHVFAFPSSVDTAHFARARQATADPADQAGIPHPRLGFFGVIDERMDFDLLTALADTRPDWHLVMIGPVAKIDPGDLPQRTNIHYLGRKEYRELPTYLAGWDVALLPFAINQSTRFISPTKTPEYLAAGKPVVSTPIRDVVRPYGTRGLVHIATTAGNFVKAIEQALAEDGGARIQRADAFLAQESWDHTWERMRRLIEEVIDTGIEEEDRVTAFSVATPAD
jgi:glycosyltransferase involved in cell wall biosynthesis